MSAQSSPEGPLPAKDSQLLFAAGESPTVEAGMQARRAALLKLNESYDTRETMRPKAKQGAGRFVIAKSASFLTNPTQGHAF